MKIPIRRLKYSLSFALLFMALLSAKAQVSAPAAAAQALTIEGAEELARGRSDAVVARRAAAEAALRATDAARASLLPHLSGSLSGAWLANPPAGVTVARGMIATTPLILPPSPITIVPDAKSSYFKGNLSFTQPLLAWGKIRAGLDLALLESRMAEADAEGTELDSARQANRAYFSALLSQRSVSILYELRSLAEQILLDRQQALDEGFVTRADILSSRADLADLESRIVEAREGAASSLESLALLTGLEPDSIDLASDFRARLPEMDEAGIKTAAAGSSTSFREAGLRLSQARRGLELQKGSELFKPDVSFFASLDASGQDIPFSGTAWMDTWAWDLSLGIAAKADLFDGGAARARRREASAKVEAATAALAAAGKSTRLEARRAIEAGRRAQAALAASAARSEWAAEALRNASSSAAADLMGRAQLNGIAIREASARLELLGARYALEEAAADLERLDARLGGGPGKIGGGPGAVGSPVGGESR